MEVRPGFRQTEMGILPTDWQATTVGEIAEVKGGKRLPLGTSLSDTVTPHPYIRVTDMHFGGVDPQGIRYVPEDVFPAIRNYRISVDDLFISVAGTLGIVGKVPPELDGANLTENADKITNLRCDRDFLLHSLMASRIQQIIESEKTVGAQPKLAIRRIQTFPIPLPPSLPEQRAIAEVLTDVDALIAVLDRLIAKKRAIKQGAMQQLLRPKAGWTRTQLGDEASFHKGKGLPKSELDPFGAEPCIHYGELFTKYPETITQTLSRTNNSSGAFRSLANDVLMPTSDVTPNGLATASCVLRDQVILGGDILVIRAPSSQLNGSFLSYVIRWSREQVMQLVTGTTVYHLYGSDMRKFRFSMPEIEHQQAIVGILSDMDAEIAALEARRDKTRALKQGMMQELLTGKTRLL